MYACLAYTRIPEQNIAQTAVDIYDLSTLSTAARKRSIYDQFGEEGLKGRPGAGDNGEGGANYNFSGDPREIFSQFFGGQDPFAMFGNGGGSASFRMTGGPGMFQFGGTDSGMGHNPFFGDNVDFSPGSKRHRQDPPIEHDLLLSLEELYQGGTKKMKISRHVLSPDGMRSREDKVVTITVRSGWKEGTKITFPQEGDQGIGRIPADIVFKVKEKPHPLYKRDGNDLKYTATLSLRDALCGATVQVPLIDKRTHTLHLHEVVQPTSTRILRGEGMPLSKNPNRRGDMIVSFDIKFPSKLSWNSKEEISRVLPSPS